MSALLAKTRLAASVLADRATMRNVVRDMDAEGEGLRIQSHYTVEGSHQERIEKVVKAFRSWYKESDNYDYRYSSVLSIDDAKLTFYTDSYYTNPGPNYYTIGYSIDADGNAVLDKASLKMADATIVVRELSGTESAEEIADSIVQAAPVVETPVVAAAPVQEAVVDPVGETTIHPADDVVVPATSVATPVVEPIVETPAAVAPVAEPVAAGATTSATVAEPVVAAVVQADTQTEIDRLTQSADPTLLLQSRAIDKATGESYTKVLQSAVETIKGKEHTVLTCVATRADIVNSQGQVYPKAVWEAQVARLNEQAKAGKFTGKLEHQGDKGLETVAILWKDSFRMDGSDLVGEAIVLQAGPGEVLQAFIDAGGSSDFSTVGYGATKTGEWLGQTVQIIQPDFFCTAIDAVKHGSSFGSTTTGVSTETIPAAQSQSQAAPIEGAATEAAPTPISPTGEASTTTQTQGNQNDMNPDENGNTATLTPEQRVQADALAGNLIAAKATKTSEARAALSDVGFVAYQNAVAGKDDAASFYQAHDQALALLKQSFAKPAVDPAAAALAQGASYAPTAYTVHVQGSGAPQTREDVLDRLVADVDEHWQYDRRGKAAQNAAEARELGQSDPGVKRQMHALKGQRAALRMVLQNMSNEQIAPGVSGGAALDAIIALEQGNAYAASQILTHNAPLQQALVTGTTTASGNNNPGGAPLSAPMVFAMVSRVFPMLIMGEIAAVQPMDRPKGIIFYKDALRVVDGTNANDKRIDVNTSANPFDPNFSNNNTEGAQPAMVRLRLSSIDVNAVTKKLNAAWTVEEMQDLRAYHGLDAEAELMADIATEIAIEKNMIVLNAMLAAASGSSRVYGAKAPATGWNQKDWDKYISTYMNRVMIDIQQVRQAPVTHIVMGLDAMFYASKALQWTIDPASDPMDMTRYAGSDFNAMVTMPNGNRLRIIATSLWTGLNSFKMLFIRRGETWSDTPFVYSPYAEFSGPALFDPNTNTTIRGVLTRDAYTTVVPEAMGVLTVDPAATGVPL